jgi:hypothetical protein
VSFDFSDACISSRTYSFHAINVDILIYLITVQMQPSDSFGCWAERKTPTLPG